MSISDETGKTNDVDPIDRDAATIDARSDDAREQIAELVEHAEHVGRDVDDSPIRPTDDTPTEETQDDPAVSGEIDGD
jgi:hypothetical protein